MKTPKAGRTDSESSSISSSSRDSEQEEVHCLMADQTTDDEVFDFSNVEFTREDLVSALNDMVKEYRKLSHSFEEVKAENSDLKISSAEPSAVELGEADSLKIELSKLTAENELLREESSELKYEIESLNELVSSWNQSSRSLHKLKESQNPANDRTSLGFNSSDSSEGETSTQSQLAHDKFNKMSFVKANVVYDPCESMTYNDQIPQKLNHKVKAGIGFQKPENSKPSWLKNKLDKDKAKAGRKAFVPNQSWRSSKIVKSGWKKVVSCRLNQLQSLAIFRLLTMASSYYTNTLHVNFASVLAMDDPGMVSMFQALMAFGLEGFLGCPAVIYEAALVDFFANSSVRDGMVFSIVHGVTVEFSEQLFAETFELPVEGLTDLTEIPNDLVFDARSIVSFSGEPVSMSGKKKEMKFEYHLLCDVMAKTISVKYLASLPRIRVDDKGKKPLMEKDPVKGNPMKEQVLLILADIECLVQLREKIIDDDDRFFNSFSFKKLASLKVEDISAKEELVLSWGEAESTRIALNRRMYILTKYRELLLRKFLEARKLNFTPGAGASAVEETSKFESGRHFC
ncbi:hypothetical protein F511_09425 [Dorcoceras hygrometricum]|uniref:Dystroglycan-like n=1 Tax=Dorcoceras hygrometricum TaxID=472368 RepID=A0A2Z7AS41_9LAMI|nr:hypothetical protein F511_09425 [Dorcoceras hygrometricum]